MPNWQLSSLRHLVRDMPLALAQGYRRLAVFRLLLLVCRVCPCFVTLAGTARYPDSSRTLKTCTTVEWQMPRGAQSKARSARLQDDTDDRALLSLIQHCRLPIDGRRSPVVHSCGPQLLISRTADRDPCRGGVQCCYQCRGVLLYISVCSTVVSPIFIRSGYS